MNRHLRNEDLLKTRQFAGWAEGRHGKKETQQSLGLEGESPLTGWAPNKMLEICQVTILREKSHKVHHSHFTHEGGQEDGSSAYCCLVPDHLRQQQASLLMFACCYQCLGSRGGATRKQRWLHAQDHFLLLVLHRDGEQDFSTPRQTPADLKVSNCRKASEAFLKTTRSSDPWSPVSHCSTSSTHGCPCATRLMEHRAHSCTIHPAEIPVYSGSSLGNVPRIQIALDQTGAMETGRSGSNSAEAVLILCSVVYWVICS